MVSLNEQEILYVLDHQDGILEQCKAKAPESIERWVTEQKAVQSVREAMLRYLDRKRRHCLDCGTETDGSAYCKACAETIAAAEDEMNDATLTQERSLPKNGNGRACERCGRAVTDGPYCRECATKEQLRDEQQLTEARNE